MRFMATYIRKPSGIRRLILVPAIGAVVSFSVAADPAAVSGALTLQMVDRDSACWWDPGRRSSFSGSTSTRDVGGRTVIDEQIGIRGSDLVIQKTFGDLRLCMIAENVADPRRTLPPSQWAGLARRLVMEARRGDVVQRLETARPAAGGDTTSWSVGGKDRPFDEAARQWRDRKLAVLDTSWELSRLRGEVSSLRGRISSIRGQESSLRGEISSLRGEVSSMRGRVSAIKGEESSLRGRISSINGHVSSLRGAISSERGAISSLNAGRYRREDADNSRLVAQHEAEITRLEQEIRSYDAPSKVAAVEREIAALDTDGKVAKIEAEIRTFDLDRRVAEVQRRIEALDVGGKVAGIERQISALDVDRRTRELENRRDAELKRLEAAIAAIR
jgi:predicted  nucleic acid-binding Zn-ribbon protein